MQHRVRIFLTGKVLPTSDAAIAPRRMKQSRHLPGLEQGVQHSGWVLRAGGRRIPREERAEALDYFALFSQDRLKGGTTNEDGLRTKSNLKIELRTMEWPQGGGSDGGAAQALHESCISFRHLARCQNPLSSPNGSPHGSARS